MKRTKLRVAEKTHLQVGYRVETFDDFVGFKRAVRAVADRHKMAVPTLQVEAVAAAVDDTNVRRRLRNDAEC